MDPRLRLLLQQCFDGQKEPALVDGLDNPAQADHPTFELDLETLEKLHSQAGLPMPPAHDLASYYYHFEALYCRLDGKSTTDGLAVVRSLQALALMGDRDRLERFFHFYYPSTAKVSQAYLALARGGHTEAMGLLHVPSPLEWSVLEIALETSNVSLFRQTLTRLDFKAMGPWPPSGVRQKLNAQPQCCRLFLLALAAQAPELLEKTFSSIYPAPRQPLSPWLLKLLLELVDLEVLTLPKLAEKFSLAVASQVGQLLEFAQARPAMELDLASMLYDQIVLGASFEVVIALHKAALEKQPQKLRDLLGSILAASLADFASPGVGAYFQGQYSKLSWSLVFNFVTLEEFTLGSSLPELIKQEQALYQGLQPLLAKAALETFTEGVARLDTQIRLQLLTPEEAFNALYWLWLMGSNGDEEDQPQYSHPSYTGLEVLQKLQAFKGTFSARLVLLGLGFDDPLPLEDPWTYERSMQLLGLVEFCAAYRSVGILAQLLPAVVDWEYDNPGEFYGMATEMACAYDRHQTVGWLLGQHDFADEMKQDYAKRYPGMAPLLAPA